MDIGHRETDLLLDEMEKKVSKVYAEAVSDVQGKLEDYFRRFDIKDEKWRQMVASGERTTKEYQTWRTGQLMIGDRWKEMLDTLAEDLHNANEIARSVCTGYMPEVYALNHDYATFTVEKGSRLDTSYTLYDRHAAERMLREEQVLPDAGSRMKRRIAEGKDVAWQKGQIQSVTLQSILQGESIPNMAKRIARTMGESNHASTIRYARTAATSAQNAGRLDAYKRAEDMGIKMQQTWVATLDGRTRHEHRQLDGQTVGLDEPFKIDGYEIRFPGDPSAPGYLIWNCFPGKTNVATDANIVRSYKSYYEGDLVKIKTSGGTEFSCTPNHPILTPRGWISAARLHNGDDVLVTFGANSVNPRRNPNIKHILARMDTFHDFWKFLFGFERVGILSVNFHGDIPASDVEIVSKKRFLRFNCDTSRKKSVNKFLFKLSNTLVSSKSHFVSCLRRINIPSLCFVSGGGNAFSFFWRGIRHADVHGFRSVSDMNPGVSEYPIDNLPGETEIRSELLDGLTGNVFLDQIVSVEISPFSGHVYNLQTENGYYFVGNSITQNAGLYNGAQVIVKNCRCTTIAQIKGHERDVSDTSLRENEKLGEMTYDEWKEGRGTSERITSQEETSEAMRRRTIEEDYTRQTERTLTDAYETHRIANDTRSVPVADFPEGVSPVSVNFGSLGEESARAFSETIGEMTGEFDTPLTRVRTMTKQEYLAGKDAFAFVSHDYTSDSAQLVINPVKCKDAKALGERIIELGEHGYCVKVRPEYAERYVATHEFGHTLLGMQNPLNNKTNWVNADYDSVRAARKEIESVYESYMKAVSEATKKAKDYELQAILASDAGEMERLGGLAVKAFDELDGIKLSDYSLTSSDEFLAEAFTNETIGQKSNPYAIQVMDVLRKYFGR